MLELNEITKSYSIGAADAVQALKGINIKFRRCDLVSILGPSGCGKSTTLNIIGGLDQYTSGDLVINGRSTKGFKDRDWDNYRNHSVGFIFQSYNLIRHQTVLDNVELALTLSGVSKKDRRERAKKALIDVGLAEQIDKTPSEMSGGQMQRVAIARALVNNPDIILADEPTGALDSKTSVQVMEILKEVAKDRLVVMVTHNPELAEQYSTRIIRMKDGLVVDDTRPLTAKEIAIEKEKDKVELAALKKVVAEESGEEIPNAEPRFKIFKNLNKTNLKTPKEIIDRVKEKRKQPHLTQKDQFKLSLKNLFTKKGRTILTAFAGSVGIFGIGAVLAISQGMNGYIEETETKTLSSTPLTISSSATDYTALLESVTDMIKNSSADDLDPERAKDPQVWRKNVVGNLAKLVDGVMQGDNNLGGFKTYLDEQVATPGSKLNQSVAGIFYNYNLNLSAFYKDSDGIIHESNLMDQVVNLITNHLDLDSELLKGIDLSTITPLLSTLSSLSGGSSLLSLNIWEELLTENNHPENLNPMILKQYEVVGEGHWPSNYDEIVVICDANYEIPDVTLYSLGLIPEEEMGCLMNDAINGTKTWDEYVKEHGTTKNWNFEALKKQKYRIIPNCYFYQQVGTQWNDIRDTQGLLGPVFDSSGIDLKISGIVKLKDEFAESGGLIGGAIGYTQALRDKVIAESKNSNVYKAQVNSPGIDITNGLPFKVKSSGQKVVTKEDRAANFKAYVEEIYSALNKTGAEKEIAISEAASLYRRYLVQYDTEAGSKVEDALVDRAYDIFKTSDTIRQIVARLIGENPDTWAKGSEAEAKADIRAHIDDTILSLVLVSQGMTEEAAKEYLKNLPSDRKDALKREIFKQVASTLILEHDLASDETRADEFKDWYTTGAYHELITDPTLTEEEKIEQLANWYDTLIEFSKSSYDDNLVAFGGVNLDKPASIKIYANTFGDKDKITSGIDDYNSIQAEEAAKIKYTDYVGFILSSVGKILNIITYVLIAFAAISLVVSSIMIAVITLISVQERTKEIGILRAIGASKRNVSGMFKAETVIIGLMSGVLGVAISYLVCLPLNLILRNITGAMTFTAILAPWKAIVLIAISIALTVLSGLIPSNTAAKKDPVVALRSE